MNPEKAARLNREATRNRQQKAQTTSHSREIEARRAANKAEEIAKNRRDSR